MSQDSEWIVAVTRNYNVNVSRVLGGGDLRVNSGESVVWAIEV